MSDSLPGSVAVVGLGLIGGSLCRAMRAARPALRIVGIDVDPDTTRSARAAGVCDASGDSPELLAGAQVAVLCSPLDTIPGWLTTCAELAPEILVTDCGSTKAWIVDRSRGLGVRFLGGHPMAGRERGGWECSDADLFDGCTWILTPEPGAGIGPFSPWVAMLAAIGAHVEVMTPSEHDQAVAWSSHLPLAVSSALVNAIGASSEWPAAGLLTAGGFRDGARLAGGDPRLHTSIATTNAEALGGAIDGLTAELNALRAILDDRAALIEYFERARQTRNRWLKLRAQSGRPVL